MQDRDSLYELFDIVDAYAKEMNLPLTASALPYIKDRFGKESDVYFRRRLSVARTILDFHLIVPKEDVDILIMVTLSHYLPVDTIPYDFPGIMSILTVTEPKVSEVLSILKLNDYADKESYQKLTENRYALLIRLAERAVLMESLYEWSPTDAQRFIRETKDHFLPMCIYAKENYRELLGPASIIMEKLRNLLILNETMLLRYQTAEDAVRSEIITLREDNAALRSMLVELKFAIDRDAKVKK